MIFLTVGSQLPFDRLVAAMDEVVSILGVPAFAQIGRSTYRPRSMEYAQVLPPSEFESRMKAAEIIVAHAGIGTVLQARSFGKPLVVYPRRSALGEHRNDHQVATTRALSSVAGVHVANSRDELENILRHRPLPAIQVSQKSARHEQLIGALREIVKQ